MTLTRSPKETVTARAQRDPAFCDALLAEAVDRFLAGEIETGKAVLHDSIDATIGFERRDAQARPRRRSERDPPVRHPAHGAEGLRRSIGSGRDPMPFLSVNHALRT
ncbi:hypothetical protein HNR00_004240 [Methylorubrum rhodinum]|uniref:Uncharacterized protein n=1 Tax=Methylorubrum rhodinum TaxID=29428 RepID=A0A840ZPF6_9HYPH|nr:hypothetical protein [Methylorubrum rhodinum]